MILGGSVYLDLMDTNYPKWFVNLKAYISFVGALAVAVLASGLVFTGPVAVALTLIAALGTAASVWKYGPPVVKMDGGPE